jgi:GT2 family glycosyltransferase
MAEESIAAPISVVIPTCGRAGILRGMLRRLLECEPAPAEILVQVDAMDAETVPMLEQEFSGLVSWEQNKETTGPGGGRNLLIQRAKFPVVVTLDDDSWPESRDFFAGVERLAETNPEAGVLAFPVNVRGQKPAGWPERVAPASCFENCGCAIRREAFLQTEGFLPLRHAYGMEEADVALQLMDRGWQILNVPDLWVYHDTAMTHHASAAVNAAQITNTALLAFLRYPASLWLLGFAQTLSRVRYAVSVGRFRGIAGGLVAIPFACWKYRGRREPVKKETVELARRLRK